MRGLIQECSSQSVIDSLALEALTGDQKCGFLCIYAHSYVYGN